VQKPSQALTAGNSALNQQIDGLIRRGTIRAVRVHFTHLGCKLNQAELEALARDFVSDGHQIATSIEEADLHVINSCTVTAAAARDSRKVARRGSRQNHALTTVLTGCYVESDPGQARELAGVDLVVGNAEKSELLAKIYEAFPEHLPPRKTARAPELPCLAHEFGHARASVKVEDGCNMLCSFCIIPSTRGAQRSRSPAEVVSEVDMLVRRGFREVVITGVQISSYRHSRSKLFDLVVKILDETSVERLRLSSIAPWQFDERLLSLFASGRVCRHFHLSLQSGCTTTLERMRRPYTSQDFESLLRAIRAHVPGIAITTDVIVGFPGETDSEFDESLAFVDACGFARIHAFPYSERPGTEAESLPDPVPHPIRRERMKRMLDVATRAERRFHNRRQGEAVDVLWEARKSDGLWWGTSDNYLRVVTAQEGDLTRQRQQTEVLSVLDQKPPAIVVRPRLDETHARPRSRREPLSANS